MANGLVKALRRQGFRLYVNTVYPSILKKRVREVAAKQHIKVVFFAMNVAMWHYKGVYDLLSRDERFECHIVLTSARQNLPEQRTAAMKALRNFFDTQGTDYIDFDDERDEGYDVKGNIDPDIVFYPQPYDDQYVPRHSYFNFTSRLICYIPYSVNVIKDYRLLCDLPIHNLAWKVYCPLKADQEMARRLARNHGRNWVVSGYHNLDNYLSDDVNDVWKIKDRAVKRLIWAPHFSIIPESTWLKSRSNFLWMAKPMLDIAERYNGRLQIAFKPHPWLKAELYKHPDWGKARTDDYYSRWADMANTQLETGAFVDLFKSSDAMIHDSASFTAEYLFVNKPVAFVTTDFERIREDHSEFGRAALDQHYLVHNVDEVQAFIEQVVLGGEDTMRDGRTRFFETVLKPNVSGTTSRFIVNDMKRGLGII